MKKIGHDARNKQGEPRPSNQLSPSSICGSPRALFAMWIYWEGLHLITEPLAKRSLRVPPSPPFGGLNHGPSRAGLRPTPDLELYKPPGKMPPRERRAG